MRTGSGNPADERRDRASWPEFGFGEDRPSHDPAGQRSSGSPIGSWAPEHTRARPQSAGAQRPERPRTVGPLEAFLRHPVVVVVPILIGLGIAAFAGLQRDAVYTSEARITVGRVDVPAYTLQDVVIGNQALAAGYARAISSAPVLRATGRATGLSQGEVNDRLDATPVPGSTLIQVDAEGGDSDEAVGLANAGAVSLISYIERVTRATQGSDPLDRFARSQREVIRLERRLSSLERRNAPRGQIERARVSLAAARLRSSNLANVYRGNNSDPTTGSPLRLIAPAATATSDSRVTLQRLLLIGGAAGLVAGLGAALLLANRGRLRAMRE